MFKKEYLLTRFASILDLFPRECSEAFKTIIDTYSSKNRYYHNTEHLYSMLNVLERSTLCDQASLLAVFYHDIVYDVTRTDNEHESGDLAYDALIKLEVSLDIAERVRFLIQLTAGHVAPPGDELAGAFLDADMAILGSQPFRFVEYSHDIAAEYSTFPNYIAERIKFLESLLEREYIYHTTYFRERFAKQAVVNITNELKFLNARFNC